MQASLPGSTVRPLSLPPWRRPRRDAAEALAAAGPQAHGQVGKQGWQRGTRWHPRAPLAPPH